MQLRPGRTARPAEFDAGVPTKMAHSCFPVYNAHHTSLVRQACPKFKNKKQ